MKYHIKRLQERGIKGVIYDLDGTIADSMGIWQDIYQELFSTLSLPFDNTFLNRTNHIPMAERAKLLKEEFALRLSEEDILSLWREIANRYYRDCVSVKIQTLQAIKEQVGAGMSLSVATATDVSCCAYFLKEKGLAQYFCGITGLNEVTRPKTFPDVYLFAAKKMGLRAEECAVFEDSLVGMKGAKAGGFCVVAVDDRAAEQDKKEIIACCDFYLE